MAFLYGSTRFDDGGGLPPSVDHEGYLRELSQDTVVSYLVGHVDLLSKAYGRLRNSVVLGRQCCPTKKLR